MDILSASVEQVEDNVVSLASAALSPPLVSDFFFCTIGRSFAILMSSAFRFCPDFLN